jgi:hypothetical protein
VDANGPVTQAVGIVLSSAIARLLFDAEQQGFRYPLGLIVESGGVPNIAPAMRLRTPRSSDRAEGRIVGCR